MRNINYRLLGLSALLIVFGFGFWASAEEASRPLDLSDVTIVVGTPNKTGLRRSLIASGQDKNLPYKIKWAVFDSTPPLTEALRAGKVDIGGGGETGVLFAIANGAKITILAGTALDTTQAGYKSDVLVLKDSPLKSLADLRGKKIGIPYYTAQHYQLAKALDAAGIPWDRSLILNLNTVDGLSALLNKQIDAFVVWDPNAAIAETQYGARGIASLRNAVHTAGMLYAPTDAINDPAKKEALRDLTRRIIRAQAWVQQHKEEWAQEISTQAQIPLAAALLTTTRSGARYVPAGDPATLSLWQQEIEYFHKLGQFRSEFKISDFVATDFDDIVREENARIEAGKSVTETP